MDVMMQCLRGEASMSVDMTLAGQTHMYMKKECRSTWVKDATAGYSGSKHDSRGACGAICIGPGVLADKSCHPHRVREGRCCQAGLHTGCISILLTLRLLLIDPT